MATAINQSGSYTLIVDRLKKETVDKAIKLGVMKNLVTLHTDTGGNELQYPVFDKSTAAGNATPVLEGVEFGTINQYKNDVWKSGNITKKVFATDLTDEDKMFSSEQLYSYHSDLHSYKHMIAMEKTGVKVFASFTSTLTATSTSGLTLARLFDAVTILEGKAYTLARPYSLVGLPSVYNYLAKDMSQQGVSSYYGPVGAMADKVLADYFVSQPMPGVVNYYNCHPGALTASAKTVCGLFTKDSVKLWAPKMFEIEPKRKPEAATEQYFSRCYYLFAAFRKESGVKLTVTGTVPS